MLVLEELADWPEEVDVLVVNICNRRGRAENQIRVFAHTSILILEKFVEPVEAGNMAAAVDETDMRWWMKRESEGDRL